jgi:hypothetical protein
VTYADVDAVREGKEDWTLARVRSHQADMLDRENRCFGPLGVKIDATGLYVVEHPVMTNGVFGHLLCEHGRVRTGLCPTESGHAQVRLIVT